MIFIDSSGWNVKQWKYNSSNIESQLHNKNSWIARNYRNYQIEEIYVDGAYAIRYRRAAYGIYNVCC